MSSRIPPSDSIHRTLLKPFRLASILVAAALFVSLGFLAYTAWSSANRLDPLERHLTHLQGLQKTSLGIQELLIRHLEDKAQAEPGEFAELSAGLEQLLEAGDNLHPDTPDSLRRARDLLDSGGGDSQASLLSALQVIRHALSEENDLQRQAVMSTRRSAETEFAVAAVAMLLVPLSTMLLLAYIRHRSFRSIGMLSNLLDNVGNLDFRTMDEVAADDPLAGVFERYNQMTAKLREANDAASQRAENLENQVRTASETLLRQQSELENGARLAALGEFSARVAHELRNPISGITVALRNLETEIEEPEHVERVALIADEMDRVTRLLNSLLEKAPGKPETPVRVNMTALVGDVARLFRYQLPPGVAVETDVEDAFCMLPRDTVRQVLINLLKNSGEAIGGDAGVIGVEMKRTGNTCRLVVSDSGPGYPDDLLKQGVRPFQTGKTSGTGLGMSVIQRLVQSVGGGIDLSRGPNGGAVTTVTLPFED
ncbi:sensor histidine kinase [Oricola nitratireducens]|uniref:sensor histidine kinase n=1 Tax=Oricola nitratireducens TaxID=2775868 RepID=UPI0018674EEE|nr:ATP-binding protein [Oricola nitratireducens]